MKVFTFNCDRCGKQCRYGEIRKVTTRIDSINAVGETYPNPETIHIFELCEVCNGWFMGNLVDAAKWSRDKK